MKLLSKNTSAIFLTTLFCWTSWGVNAQNQDKKKFNEQITIVGEFTPTIVDANKINISPKLNETEKVEVPLNEFPIIAKQLNTEIQLQAVKPLNIRFDKRSQSWNNYLKVGIGNYLNPYIDFFHNGGNTKDFSYGIHAKHYSSNTDINGIPESTFGKNLIEGELSKTFEDHILNAKINYERHGLHYYGLFNQGEPENDVSLDSIRQIYNYINFKADFGNYPTDEESFRYLLKTSFAYTGDHFDAKENNLNFKLDLYKPFHLFSFSDGEKIGLLAENENYFYKVKEIDNNGSLLRLKPYIKLNYDMFKFYGAVDFSFTSGTESDFFLYPDLKAEFEAIPKKLVLYAGLKGGLKRNSLRRLTQTNAFVSSNPLTTWESNKIKFYGGVKGNIVEAVDYGLELSYDSFENMALFHLDPFSYQESSLAPLYVELNRFRVEASLAYHLTDKLNARAYFRYNSYAVEKLDEAYQLPKTELGIDISAMPIEKLHLNLSVVNRGAVPTLNLLDPSEKNDLESWTDLSIGGAYDITPTISAFVQGNNLLNNKYQIWQNYPTQGLNVMIGGSIKF